MEWHSMNLLLTWGLKWQGDQKSPGIIPLAIKDLFGIIQEVL
jgi:hypothetical protein